MSRLADYLAIFGYNFEAAARRAEESCGGKLVQRFPITNWEDFAFVEHQELFCQPCGWHLTSRPQAPTFFVHTFTSESGSQCYAAMFNFYEPVSSQQKLLCMGRRPSLGLSSESLPDDQLEQQQFHGSNGELQQAAAADPHLVRPADLYAPKSLVLLSRHDCPEVLHDCLAVIYTAYVDGSARKEEGQLERIVGNLLGGVIVSSHVPTRFSISAHDHQIVRPPMCSEVPVTGSSVTLLFRQLGIHNCILLVTALLTGCRVALFSYSYARLTSACRALTALLYPFNYEHTLVPILPKPLLEYVNATVPFLYGIHGSLKSHVDAMEAVFDLICADLDLGCVHEKWSGGQSSVTQISECTLRPVIGDITAVLNPSLLTADYAFPPSSSASSSAVDHPGVGDSAAAATGVSSSAAATASGPSTVGGEAAELLTRRLAGREDWIDKQIRAVFIRMYSELLNGYRSCLSISRVLPENVISFHKASFLGARGFADDKFMQKFTSETVMFYQFCQTRGPPFRVTDTFDDEYAGLAERLAAEAADPSVRRERIDRLALRLYENENPPGAARFQKIVPQPAEGADQRLYQLPFPQLNAELVGQVINNALTKQPVMQKLATRVQQQCRIVRPGQRLEELRPKPRSAHHQMSDRQKLDIMEACVRSIFEGRISEAKKVVKAVKRDLVSRWCRLRMVSLLNEFVCHRGYRTLDQQPFELVCELLVHALKLDTQQDECECALLTLPLLITLHCVLPSAEGSDSQLELLACMTEEVQSCPAWTSDAFWHWAFNRFVQDDLRRLYLDEWHKRMGLSEESEEHSAEQSALDVAAKVMSRYQDLGEEERQALQRCEEDSLENIANDFIFRLVMLRVPLDRSRRRLESRGGGPGSSRLMMDTGCDNNSSSQHTSGAGEADSIDKESGICVDSNEAFVQELETWVKERFLDRVCSENRLSVERADRLKTKLHDFINYVHLENVDSIWAEYRKIPKSQKAKILPPALLPGERHLVPKPLRAYLYADGRREPIRLELDSSAELATDTAAAAVAAATAGHGGGSALTDDELTLDIAWLPAEGIFLLTNYRIIFKGVPSNVLQSEKVIVRYFPLAALYKIKRLGKAERDPMLLPTVQNRHSVREQVLFKSVTFEALKIGFDAAEEEITELLDSIKAIRYPAAAGGGGSGGGSGGPVGPGPRAYFFPGAIRCSAETAAGQDATLADRKRKLKQSTLTRIMKGTASAAQRVGLKRRTLLQPVGTTRPSESDASSNRSSLMTDCDAAPIRPLSQQHQQSSELLRSLLRSPAYEDLRRLDLLPLQQHQQSPHHPVGHGSQQQDVRVTYLNFSHDLVPSYPALLTVPAGVSDDALKRLARAHRQGRFPVLSWRCQATGALLLRSGGFQALVSAALSSASAAQAASGAADDDSGSIGAGAPGYPAASSSGGGLSCPLATPVQSRRRSPTTNSSASGFNKFLSSMRASSSAGAPNIRSGVGISRSKSDNSPASMADLTNTDQAVGGTDTATQTALYIFTDRAFLNKIKAHRTEGVELLAVDDYPTRQSVRDAFKKLMRVCLPSKLLLAGEEKRHRFLRKFDESGWPALVRRSLRLAGAVADLVDCGACSVLMALEDGWDATTCVLALAQLMLDPHYRSMSGFRALVEKEWLLFGHQFDSRYGRLKGADNQQFAPHFLLFADCVHQLLQQFPLSFEFNQYFLATVAYHSVSCRFRNFLGNCEADRLAWASGTAAAADAEDDDDDFWQFVGEQNSQAAHFFNLTFSPTLGARREFRVLRPATAAALLQPWRFLTSEDAAYGPPYDADLCAAERRQQAEVAATASGSGADAADAPEFAEAELGYNYSWAVGAACPLARGLEELAAAQDGGKSGAGRRVATGGLRCVVCGFACHEKCAAHVRADCTPPGS
uniref:UDENN domain-containing protein n=1 Tax=Macrostomum lignano TaxID=282301 RepID=A0A1I8HMA5_9PLAT